MSDNSDNLDLDKLRAVTNQMIDAISHPAYVEAMRVIKSMPRQERLKQAKVLLTPASLREKGVPLPSDMRISSRYFEPGLMDAIEVGDYLPPGVETSELNKYYDSLAASMDDSNPVRMAGVCACGGNGNVCGGAGAS